MHFNSFSALSILTFIALTFVIFARTGHAGILLSERAMRPLFALEDSVESQYGRSLRQFVDRYPLYAVRPMVRRFDLSFQPQADSYAEQEDAASPRQVKKRNNAELVNHILKNFGNLDRLGDVGRR